jgi:NADH-quinone oxidoreductase subunit J
MSVPDILLNVFFYAVAILAIGGGLGVALSKNIVRSSFSLLLVLFAAAAMYAVMKADFMFAAQVMIYVGGILVLIIFAVMLTHKITDVKISNDSTPGPVSAGVVVLTFLVLLGLVFAGPEWNSVGISDEELAAKYQASSEAFSEMSREGAREAGYQSFEKLDAPETKSLTKALGVGLMSRYLLAFEVVSVLLLAALIGAAFLARKEVKDEKDLT